MVLVLAHGAGAGMRHPFLESIAQSLAARDVATFRYQFPYMEAKRRRPDSPAIATATVRAAVETAAQALPGVPLFAGGKSFGGRMTSTAAAELALPGVRGIVFLGFPLHPPGKPDTKRAEHLRDLTLPMLFLQGTRDDFAQLDLLEPVVNRLANRATLHLIAGGDHSFRVQKSAGRSNDEVMTELVQAIVNWGGGLLA
jgi:predicted alpha/beta-hydrolase family hydrolase